MDFLKGGVAKYRTRFRFNLLLISLKFWLKPLERLLSSQVVQLNLAMRFLRSNHRRPRTENRELQLQHNTPRMHVNSEVTSTFGPDPQNALQSNKSGINSVFQQLQKAKATKIRVLHPTGRTHRRWKKYAWNWNHLPLTVALVPEPCAFKKLRLTHLPINLFFYFHPNMVFFGYSRSVNACIHFLLLKGVILMKMPYTVAFFEYADTAPRDTFPPSVLIPKTSWALRAIGCSDSPNHKQTLAHFSCLKQALGCVGQVLQTAVVGCTCDLRIY